MKETTSGSWQSVGDSIAFNLVMPNYELVFRTVNLANVTGPEHRIVIKRK